MGRGNLVTVIRFSWIYIIYCDYAWSKTNISDLKNFDQPCSRTFSQNTIEFKIIDCSCLFSDFQSHN